jgi:hypothetical protein
MARTVIEDEARGVVLLDGKPISGWLTERRACPQCGAGVAYADDYDADLA